MISSPCVRNVLPVDATAVQRASASNLHCRPVSVPVPVVMPTGVHSVVGVAPAATKIVAVVDVAVVVRNPRALIQNAAPGYRYHGWTRKSLAEVACGLIVAVVAVVSDVPAVVCHGAPA